MIIVDLQTTWPTDEADKLVSESTIIIDFTQLKILFSALNVTYK